MRGVHSHRRRPAKIAAEIISTASNGVPKTSIMYGARLNYKQLERYLDELTIAGLLHASERRRPIYLPTQKGRTFLGSYQEVERLTRALREKQKDLESVFSDGFGKGTPKSPDRPVHVHTHTKRRHD